MLKKIVLNELLPGHVLGEDIFGKNGRVIIARGHVLSGKEIEFLKGHFLENHTIVIYEEGNKNFPNESHEISPFKKEAITVETDSQYNSKTLTIQQIQNIIKDGFASREDYQTTKKAIEIIKRDVSEAFDFLTINNEINDKKFQETANKIIRSFQKNQEEINFEYLYLIELENWHPDTFNHSIDVAFFTLYIASQMTTDLTELESLFIGGLLHDIGKYLRYKEGENRFYEIITKTGPLSDEEFRILKEHVSVERFFKDKFMFFNQKERDNIAFAAMDHHEKIDGSGYLHQKRGMQISFAGRIVAVADIYDALIRKREYKSMVKPDIAMRHIIELAELGKLDKRFTGIFKNLLGLYPTGTVITTNKGMAIVIGQSSEASCPKVMLLEHHELGEINLCEHNEIEIYEEIE